MFSLTLVQNMFNNMYILQVMHLGYVSDYRAMDFIRKYYVYHCEINLKKLNPNKNNPLITTFTS